MTTREFQQDEPGRVFRAAWIARVRKYFPGEPKPGYVTPWDDTPGWERQAASAVYTQVAQFVGSADGATVNLSRQQKGRFVALCWIAQIYKHIPEPKPSYVADWDELPTWQQETDSDIFEEIEKRETRGVGE
ncbi:hypothetical protein [Actinomadura rubrisoli]|uniref:Uncharacterized protein n=1 Tax=Actinomadura rubrisoli TaxID=2530368 RepID=A0A4R5C9E9_9ACTN|nr:hypothetical protein [Actinomadura rubrisoli]TDD94793.1 hypothetical protein E1298_06405 [Actinomadura rubrisoli]